MFCSYCGVALVDGARFCSGCGKAQFAPPPVPPSAVRPTRAERHRMTLGILWLVYGIYSLLARLLIFSIALSFISPWLQGNIGLPHGMHGFAAIMPYLAEIALIRSVLALVTALALLSNRPWGRVIAILTAILSLLKLPFGTALAICTLWVMVPEESQFHDDAQ